MRRTVLAVVAALGSCGKGNNILLGRVEATVGTHPVVVTDCYRTSPPGPEAAPGGYHYMPCRDADIWIRDEQLTVNGRPYGHLNPHDAVLVDHSVVSIQRR